MRPEIHLAPMEGVVDFVMRDLLTQIGGIDHCVTEFIRVTEHLHSPAVLLRYAPELKMRSRTRAGTPLFLQFLGGQPQPLADNAAQAVELGALGVDLNFGCPAKTVNRHDGGASLLKTPERIFQITQAVRQAVPHSVPVTVKMRLGFEDPAACFENAQAVESAGASWLTVHCRTKTEGYRPPAHWDWIPRIREKLSSLPLVANGEIWTLRDFERCQAETGCHRLMLGRGAVAQPFLCRQIKDSLANAEGEASAPLQNWQSTRQILPLFFTASSDFKSPFFAQARTKQWLKALSLQNEEAKTYFEELKLFTNPLEFRTRLESLCS